MKFSKVRGAIVALLLVGLVFVVPSIFPAHASITYVGGAISSASSTSSISKGYTSSGSNTVFVMFAYRCNAGAITVTPSDTGGSTYSKLIEVQPDAFRCVDIYSTSAGGSVASTSFTLTFSASTSFVVMSIEEYSGIQSLGNTFSNADWSGGCGTCDPTLTSTLSSAGDFAIAFVGTPDAPGGFTSVTGNLRHNIDNAGNGGGASVDNTGSTSVTTTVQSVSGGIRWEMLSVDAQIPPPPDFALTNDAPANGLPIVDGGTGTINVAASEINGGSLTVTFSCVSPPSGITCSFAPTNCNTPCSVVLTVTVGSTVNPAFYTLTIQGQAPGPITHTTTAIVQVFSTLAAAGIVFGIVAIALIIGLFLFLGFGKKGKKRRRR